MARSLFDKYGGFANISKVVMVFYDKVLDSDIIGSYFEDVDMRRLIDHQTKFIATIMGGPASYSNEALQQVHKPHQIDQAAYDEMPALLRDSLQESGFEEEDVGTVMSIIEDRSRYVISSDAK
jgi:hemoglobin